MASFTRRFTALAQRVDELVVQIKTGNLIIEDDDVDVDDGDDVDVDVDFDGDVMMMMMMMMMIMMMMMMMMMLVNFTLLVRNQFVILCYRLK